MPRSASPISIAISLASAAALAQVGDSGELSRFPFALPFEQLGSGPSGDGFSVTVRAQGEACVAHFSAAFMAQRPIAAGWSVVGQGFDPNADAWNFGLLHEDELYFQVAVAEGPEDTCRITIDGHGSPTPTGGLRWSYPPLRLSDGSTIAVDPFVVFDD